MMRMTIDDDESALLFTVLTALYSLNSLLFTVENHASIEVVQALVTAHQLVVLGGGGGHSVFILYSSSIL
jgi:dihydroxyacetone kinase